MKRALFGLFAIALLAGCKKDEKEEPTPVPPPAPTTYAVKITVTSSGGYYMDAAFTQHDGSTVEVDRWVTGDTTITGTCLAGTHLYLIVSNGEQSTIGRIYVNDVQVAGNSGIAQETHITFFDIP